MLRKKAFVTLAATLAGLFVPETGFVGRWVETNGALALDISSDMTVRPFIRAPQFPATYEASYGRVVARSNEGSTQTFTFHNDTLTGPNGVVFNRVSSNPMTKPLETAVGTWTMS